MELDFIAWLREQLPAHPRLHLGPGDDAAILGWASQSDCVITTDLLTDGIHFQLELVYRNPLEPRLRQLASRLRSMAQQLEILRVT